MRRRLSSFNELKASYPISEICLSNLIHRVIPRTSIRDVEKPRVKSANANFQLPLIHRKICSTNSAVKKFQFDFIQITRDIQNAQKLASRLLAYDSSPETRTLLAQSVARAGQPNLLDNLINT